MSGNDYDELILKEKELHTATIITSFENKHNQFLLKQKNLYKKKLEYIQMLNNINEEIITIEKNIVNNCLHHFDQHNYIEEREDGMYGEVFRVCNRCNNTY